MDRKPRLEHKGQHWEGRRTDAGVCRGGRGGRGLHPGPNALLSLVQDMCSFASQQGSLSQVGSLPGQMLENVLEEQVVCVIEVRGKLEGVDKSQNKKCLMCLDEELGFCIFASLPPLPASFGEL